MSEDGVKIYPFITTNIGKYKISQARSGGIPINLTHIAVGDGGGSEYDPTTEQSELINQKWIGEINRKIIHPDDPNIVIVIGVVPYSIGGFFVRELSIIDEDGDTIYISAYPTSYKPTPKSNISKDMILEQWLIVEDADTIVLTPDLNVVTAIISDIKPLEAEIALLKERLNALDGGSGGSGQTTQAVLGSSFLGLSYLDGSISYIPDPVAAFLRTESGELISGAVRLDSGEIVELVLLPVNNG